MAHVYHLQVRGDEGSHAAHTALGEYYEGILDLIDTVIETYQGQYGIVDGYETIDTNGTKTKEKLAYFEELAEYVNMLERVYPKKIRIYIVLLMI
jgi:plastocyanin domain-containing protein